MWRLSRVLVAENSGFLPKAQIMHSGWLTAGTSKANNSKTSVVTAFSQPEHANAVIDRRLFCQGARHDVEFYDQSCRLMQCRGCQQYGHKGSRCRCPIKCQLCAGAHQQSKCKNPAAPFVLACTLPPAPTVPIGERPSSKWTKPKKKNKPGQHPVKYQQQSEIENSYQPSPGSSRN